jgi:hypothetical protein
MYITGQAHDPEVLAGIINLSDPGSSIRGLPGQVTHPSEKHGLSCRAAGGQERIM